MTGLQRAIRGDGAFALVELLVVMVVMSIVGAAVLGVVLTTFRSNQYQGALREVMDDGRISLDRIRTELRGGRRVLTGSDPYHLYWWVDRDEDGVPQAGERVHFCTAALGETDCATATASGQFQLIRWTDAQDQTSARTVAKTLTTTEVFSGYEADPRKTRTVTITLPLEVPGGRGPEETTMAADVRLRNVE